ncbi:UDP-glucose 4-epimerase [Salibacterium salarium]|uniref:NAD-dependent epimerase/dehydratase family protein n=1 Tax=Salibacterium salarium TaxID=284579 RepID=UPI00277FD62A|nr:NAD-dependent epimerase/dehydratase family protein [Salibacterium salarium]MDQ0300123.1 UDP-glucose 4-epimerase [Salibacterium salarium]
MKILVTGGAGFIGSHIVDELLNKKHEIIVVDNLSTGHMSNIPYNVTFYNVDVRQGREVCDVLCKEQPDSVIHLAAQVSVSRSLYETHFDGEENIMATINILEACVKANVRKITFSSTAAVYGTPDYLAIDEEHPIQPISFYGLSKRNAESYIQLYAELHDLSYTILRYGNVYGTRQDTNGEAGVIAIYVDRMLQGLNPLVFGDGKQTRDFVYVKDVAKANIAALTKGDNEIVNVSSETQTSILDIIDTLSNVNGHPLQPEYHETRQGDIRDSYLSFKKAKEILEWEPLYSFDEGMKETVEYYKGVIRVNQTISSS